MIDDWPRRLARTLVSGTATATLEEQLDALLIWLGNPDNPNVAALDAAIARTGLTRLDAAGRAYDILDRLLFARPFGSPKRILGLRNTADVAAAKQRYRCLIQAYHPDRHPARVLVHNEYTEQINIAYAAFERGARESASRGAAASGPVSTPKTARARRHRPPQRVNRYPLDAARVRLSLAIRLRRSLGGAESFQARFFVGLILFCALILASLLYAESPPQRVSETREAAVMPAPYARLDVVETPDASDHAGMEINTSPTATTATHAPNSAPPGAIVSLAGIRAEPIASATPETKIPPPAPLVLPAPEPVSKPAGTTEPASRSERNAGVLLSPVHMPSGVRAVPPPSLLDQSRSDLASGLEAPARPVGVAPIRPLQPLDSAHAPRRSPDPTTPARRAEVEAPMRAPSATPAIPPLAMVKKAEAPTGPAATAPESSKTAGCEAIVGALDRFRRAYNAGALARLMALFSADAQANETRGQSGIRELYRGFDRTSDRQIAFSGARIRPEGNGRCGARVEFSLRYRDAQGSTVDRMGTMAILFDGRGADAQILRIWY